jgi:SNF2 family DNA or RNA helicase
MGGTGPEAGAKIADAWNRGEVRVLLAHPASAGHGLNLQAGGNHAAFFGGTWDLELQDQFIARLLRQGQEADRVFVHHLLAEKTIDEVLAAAMQQKERNQETLLQWFREHALGREVSA